MLLDEIRKGESINLEFKVELPKKTEKYIKTVIAFANTSGGKIVIGVDDKSHEIVGVDKNSVFKIMDSISNAISDMCYPQIFPNITFQTVEDKSIVVIEIFPGQNRPYYMKSIGKEQGTFIRVGGTSRSADEAILKDLELQGTNKSFDELICVEHKFELSQAHSLCENIRRYLLESAITKSEKENIKEITIQNLENWGVLKSVEGTLLPTNAFILLTNNSFPFAKIQCALFKGVERVVFIDKRDFEGPLFKQIEEAYEFVLKHINLGAEINGLVRKDVYELPVEAIREAIVNAVTHRNYLDRACVQVAVYENRVEITSPGMLYGGLTIEQIKEGGSKIRNRCIAEVFSRMKIIESWGTGIKRMISSCRDYGIQEPEFLEIGDSFRVNFYRSSYKKEVHQSSPKSSPKNAPKNLNPTQQSILEIVGEDPAATQTFMAEKLGLTIRAVKKSIKDLTDKGILKREGSARNGWWVIQNLNDHTK